MATNHLPRGEDLRKCGNSACGRVYSREYIEKMRHRPMSDSEWAKSKFCCRPCSDRVQGGRIAKARRDTRAALVAAKQRAGNDDKGTPVYRLPAGTSGRRTS